MADEIVENEEKKLTELDNEKAHVPTDDVKKEQLKKGLTALLDKNDEYVANFIDRKRTAFINELENSLKKAGYKAQVKVDVLFGMNETS